MAISTAPGPRATGARSRSTVCAASAQTASSRSRGSGHSSIAATFASASRRRSSGLARWAVTSLTHLEYHPPLTFLRFGVQIDGIEHCAPPATTSMESRARASLSPPRGRRWRRTAPSRFPPAGDVTSHKEVWRGQHHSGAGRRACHFGGGGGPNHLALRLPPLQAEGEGAGAGSADAARLGCAAGKDAGRAADRAGESLRHAGRSGVPAAPARGARSARDPAGPAERARAPRPDSLAISDPRTRDGVPDGRTIRCPGWGYSPISTSLVFVRGNPLSTFS